MIGKLQWTENENEKLMVFYKPQFINNKMSFLILKTNKL